VAVVDPQLLLAVAFFCCLFGFCHAAAGSDNVLEGLGLEAFWRCC